MLLELPKEMLKNPNCYRVEYKKGYIPTEFATEHEKKIVMEFNAKIKKEEELLYKT